jgi:hypothetical protein
MPTLDQKGDAIRGEKVTFQCRSYRVSNKPIANTSRHKAQRGNLEGAVYCVIDKPFTRIREKSKKTS